MEPLTAPCPDSPKSLRERELCLSEVSKNLEGELRLLESEREDCKTPKCRTLKTMHLLELDVKSHRPCEWLELRSEMTTAMRDVQTAGTLHDEPALQAGLERVDAALTEADPLAEELGFAKCSPTGVRTSL
jgi:hypothetical protein